MVDSPVTVPQAGPLTLLSTVPLADLTLLFPALQADFRHAVEIVTSLLTTHP